MVGVAISCVAWASLPPLKSIDLQHVPLFLVALAAPWTTAGVILGNTKTGLLVGLFFAIVVMLFFPAIRATRQ